MRERIFYCPKHGRLKATTYRGENRNVTVCEPPFHPGCDCERWFYEKTKFRAKRSGES